MSAILTNYFYKNYLPIKNLEETRFWVNNYSFINNDLTKGFTHSIFAQLNKIEYLNIKNKYKTANINNQRFILYSNNSMLYLILHYIENGKELIKYDTWLVGTPHEIDETNINVYTFFDEYIAYTIEPFSGRFTMLTHAPFTNVSLRHVASGNWLYADANNLVLLGTLYQKAEYYMEIPTSKRILNRCNVRNEIEPAFSNIFEDLNKRRDYFILNRVFSQSEFLYHDVDEINNILKERHYNVYKSNIL